MTVMINRSIFVIRHSLFEIPVVLVLASCAKYGGPEGLKPGVQPPCYVEATTVPNDEPATPDSITLAVTDPIDLRHAPAPQNESERFLFRQLYETLVRIDCEGTVRPGLAVEWNRQHDDRRWVFTLRRDATFWDRAPVTGGDVVTTFDGGARFPAAIDDGVTVRTEAGQPLRVVFESDVPMPRLPEILAHPELAIVKSVGAWPWLLGSGPYGVDAESPVGPRFTVYSRGVAGGSRPDIQLIVVERGDARDVVDRGVDAMLARDPGLLGYISSTTQMDAIPLAWNRSYVVVTHRADSGGVRSDDSNVGSLRDALARDAVRVEARGALPPFWWDDDDVCPRAASGPTPQLQNGRPTLHRIVYDRNDDVARGLAERITALLRSSTPPPSLADFLGVDNRSDLTAVGMTRPEFDRQLRSKSELAYIVALPSRSPGACIGVADDVRWMLDRAQSDIFPLIETRPTIMARPGRLRAVVDWDGMPRLFAFPVTATR